MPWGPMDQFFQLERVDAIGVLYRDQRYCIDPHCMQGEPTDSAIIRAFQLDPASVVTCVFPTEGLEVQGNACATVVAIADKPLHPPTAPPTQRRDIFTYCDLRPLGVRPRCIRTSVPLLHLPTLASDFGIHLPPAFRLGVVGAPRQGNNVRLHGNPTLLFFAEEVDSEDFFRRADTASFTAFTRPHHCLGRRPPFSPSNCFYRRPRRAHSRTHWTGLQYCASSTPQPRRHSSFSLGAP